MFCLISKINDFPQKSNFRSQLKQVCFSPFLLAAIYLLMLLSGCTQSDSPKVVPARINTNSISAPKPAASKINNSITPYSSYSTMICADYNLPSVFGLSYAGSGRVKRIDSNAPPVAGVRFEVGSYAEKTDRSGFQFESSKNPTMYKSTTSDGGAAEIFSDESLNPAMICFNKIDTNFVWIDSNLIENSSAFEGSWKCSGPMGATSIKDGGILSSAIGSGQAFIWSKNGSTRLTSFLLGSSSSKKQVEFETFVEYKINLAELSSKKFSYESLRLPSQVEKNICIKADN